MLNGDEMMAKAIRMAAEALPVDFDDWGTERQVNAENAFFLFFDETVGISDEFSTWMLKSTVEERVAEALKRFIAFFLS